MELITVGRSERILYFLLPVLVFSLPFETRLCPVFTNLQWLFLALVLFSLPICISQRQLLFNDRLVVAAVIFLLTQWIAAVLAPESAENAVKAAIRVTVGVMLLCIALCVRDPKRLLKIWSVSAVLAAAYGLVDYSGHGFPVLFRESEFYLGPTMRLSGSFEYPNTAAAFFALSLPIVWTVPSSRWFRVIGSVLIWVVLIFTYSRGAAIAVILMGGIAVYLWREKLALYSFFLCVAVFFIFVLANKPTLHRFFELQPAAISADYEPEYNHFRLTPQSNATLKLNIKNTGANPWACDVGKLCGVAYRWYAVPAVSLVRLPIVITPFPVQILPQESITLNLSFTTPSAPGHYLLTWDVFQAGTGWFTGNGVFPGLVDVDILENIEPMGARINEHPSAHVNTSQALVANIPLTRTELWKAAIEILVRHPVLGIGPDNFRLLYGRIYGLGRWDTKVRSNNLYLEILTGSGIAGLVTFIMMIVIALRGGLNEATIAIGIFLVHGTVDVFLMTTPVYFAFWILLGINRRIHSHVSA